MKAIEQDVQDVLPVPTSRIDGLKHIEYIGRICYQSHNRIKEGSAEKFCNMLFNLQHFAMLEHSWACYKIKGPNYADVLRTVFDSNFLYLQDASQHVAGNWLAWLNWIKPFDVENKYYDVLKMPIAVIDFAYRHYGVELEQVHGEDIPHELRSYSVILKTDRAVTHELVRHRVASFAQESQRYCAYRDHLECIIPYWAEDGTPHRQMWNNSMVQAELDYKFLLGSKMKCKPQEARAILPNSVATQIAVTAKIDEWKHIFDLRCSIEAYPQIRRLMNEVKDTFVERKYLV